MNGKLEQFNFSRAITQLRHGRKICREGWNGKGMWIMLCTANGDYTLANGKTCRRKNYIYMKTADDCLVPWTASQTDILADDWMVAE